MHVLIVLVNGDVVKCYGVPKELALAPNMSILRAKVQDRLVKECKVMVAGKPQIPTVRLQHAEVEMHDLGPARSMSDLDQWGTATTFFEYMANDIMEYVG